MSDDEYEFALTGGGPVIVNRKQLIEGLKDSVFWGECLYLVCA